MKSHKPLMAIILTLAYLPIFSQDEEPKALKRVSVHDVFIQIGLNTELNSNGSLSDFNKLAPQSALLNTNFSGYSQSNGRNLTSNAGFSYMLGLQFKDKHNEKYKTNPLLRLGISYYTGTTLGGNLYKEDRKHYDTLISKQTGTAYYLDSITTNNYSLNYHSQQIRFDGSLIFRTNPADRWSFYSGIGLTVGASINASTDVFYSKYTSTGSSSSYLSRSSIYKFETYRNKSNMGVSAYIPIGLDFRLGKKKEFWKMTHLFYELRTGINMTSIPELRTISNVVVYNGLGVRVSWH